MRAHQHHHTGAARAALARATRRTQPSPADVPLHEICTRKHQPLRMHLLHPGASSSTRVGNVAALQRRPQQELRKRQQQRL